MDFDYVRDNTEKSLVPWASPVILGKLFYQAVGGSLILLFLLWPRKALPEFIRLGESPLSFFAVFGITLLMTAYLNLRCGLGEFTAVQEAPWIEYRKKSTYEEERPFLVYGLFGFALHTMLILLPLCPLLFISAGLSAIPAETALQALLLILLLSLLCRLFGFEVYLWLGRKGPAAYFSTRIFFVLLFSVPLIFKEKSSTLILFYAFNRGETVMIRSGLSAFALQTTVAAALAVLLIVLIQRSTAGRRRA